MARLDWLKFDRYWPAMYDMMRYLPIEDRFNATRVFQWRDGLSGGWDAEEILQLEFDRTPPKYQPKFKVNFDSLTSDPNVGTCIILKIIHRKRNNDSCPDYSITCIASEFEKIVKTFEPKTMTFKNIIRAKKYDMTAFFNTEYTSVHKVEICGDGRTINRCSCAAMNLHPFLAAFPNVEKMSLEQLHIKSLTDVHFPELNNLKYLHMSLFFTENMPIKAVRRFLKIQEDLTSVTLKGEPFESEDRSKPLAVYLIGARFNSLWWDTVMLGRTRYATITNMKYNQPDTYGGRHCCNSESSDEAIRLYFKFSPKGTTWTNADTERRHELFPMKEEKLTAKR